MFLHIYICYLARIHCVFHHLKKKRVEIEMMCDRRRKNVFRENRVHFSANESSQIWHQYIGVLEINVPNFLLL